MNLYLRYFNEEILVENVEQAIDFLAQIPEIKLNESLCQDLRKYAESKNPFPKRFKVNQRSFFIVIKTTASTMEEFKAYATEPDAEGGEKEHPVSSKEMQNRTFTAENPGWYLAKMKMKRVVAIEGTNKFGYVDSDFEAKVKAQSIQDCYNRVVDYLRNRIDVDPRSQFPSIRGRNFSAEFLGQEL